MIATKVKKKKQDFIITQRWVAIEAAKAGIRKHRWEDVAAFNQSAPAKALAMLDWATNKGRERERSVNKNALYQRRNLFLFGGTGNIGNKWDRWSGGWYPTVAVIRWDPRGRPKLIAVRMDWY